MSLRPPQSPFDYQPEGLYLRLYDGAPVLNKLDYSRSTLTRLLI